MKLECSSCKWSGDERLAFWEDLSNFYSDSMCDNQKKSGYHQCPVCGGVCIPAAEPIPIANKWAGFTDLEICIMTMVLRMCKDESLRENATKIGMEAREEGFRRGCIFNVPGC